MSQKIFIIDGDANVSHGLLARFCLAGFQVERAGGEESAEEILNKARIFRPDFVVLDLELPRVDGFSVLSGIKSDADIAEVPVFVFTGAGFGRERSENLGAERWFSKDELEAAEFVEKIKRIISNKLKLKKKKRLWR